MRKYLKIGIHETSYILRYLLLSVAETSLYKSSSRSSSQCEFRRMSSTATIVLAREDLSIPGADASPDSSTVQQSFFSLVSASNPDVIVLDFSRAPRSGADTILTIRRRSAVPILVVCDPAHPLTKAYRSAGAYECVSAPVDPLRLNQAVRRALRITGQGRAAAIRGPATLSCAGISFHSA